MLGLEVNVKAGGLSPVGPGLQVLGLRWSFGFCEGHLGRVAALRACTPLAVLAAASGLSRVVCGLNGPSVYPTRHP